MKMKFKIMENKAVCIAVIGGMDRLEKHYREEAVRSGVELRMFSRSENKIAVKLKRFDALVIFTNKVSHRVKNEAMAAAKQNGIPVFMHHSCGVCTFRDCLSCLAATVAHAGESERSGHGRRKNHY